jgi:hypothetical protein
MICFARATDCTVFKKFKRYAEQIVKKPRIQEKTVTKFKIFELLKILIMLSCYKIL